MSLFFLQCDTNHCHILAIRPDNYQDTFASVIDIRIINQTTQCWRFCGVVPDKNKG